MAKQPSLSAEVLESVCRVIADTEMGLTGQEIAKQLAEAKIVDSYPDLTKWKRLYYACVDWQNKNHCSNNIMDFLMRSMSPVRYMGKQDLFEHRRVELNKRLAFIGLTFTTKGILGRIPVATTIRQADLRADLLKRNLKERDVHADVLRFCTAELLEKNYFHAVFETAKGVANKIQELSGCGSDGGELVDAVFQINNPILLINNLQTETEKSEHRGFMNLLKGFFGMFRNTVAHAPKITWEVNEQDALDIMSLASLFHRKLANTTKIRDFK